MSYVKNIFKINLYLLGDRVNVKLKVVNFSSCYFPHINDIIALFLRLSTLMIHSYLNIYIYIYIYIYLKILTGKNCFTQFSTRNDWLAASDLFRMCLHNQLSSLCIPLSCIRSTDV